MQVSQKNSHHQDFEIKPVFGHGREERWKSFQTIFHRSVEYLYGSRILRDAEKRPDYKYRLLGRDEGVLIYSADLSDHFRSKGLKDCFEVQLLHLYKRELHESFLKEIITLARESRARSVSIRVSEQAKDLLLSIEKLRFQEIEKDSAIKIYGLSLEESKKRERSPDQRGTDEIEKRERSAQRPDLKKGKIDSPNQQMDRCPIKKQYFNLIRNGQKTIEGRINSRPFNEWKENQEVEFFCGEQSVKCRIVKVVRHSSFEEMLEKEGYKPCLPDVSSLEQGIKIYDNIPGYADKAKRFGVLAIHIQLL